MAENPEWSMDDFEIGKYIGEGKFGKVYLEREKQETDGFRAAVVALKAIFKAKLEKYRFHAHLRREIEIQHGLDHPNVLRLFAWSSCSSTPPAGSSTSCSAPSAASLSAPPPLMLRALLLRWHTVTKAGYP